MLSSTKRRPRPTLALFDPLSQPSPAKPSPAPSLGLDVVSEEGETEEDDDDQSFFSALGGDAFPGEEGLVGELVVTSPERAVHERSRTTTAEQQDLLSWDSPVKTRLGDSSSLSEPAEGSASAALKAAMFAPLPSSPPPSLPVLDHLAPTPRPPTHDSTFAKAKQSALPESPPRRQNVMDWLAETPMPSRRPKQNPDRSVRFDTSAVLPSVDASIVFPLPADASYEDLMATPAPRKVKTFAFASQDVTSVPSPPNSTRSSYSPPSAPRSPERTTLLPSMPDFDEEDDLMRTPALRKVKKFEFAHDVTTLPWPQGSPSSSPSTTLPLTTSTSTPERTAYLPNVPDLDETYDDLLTTPAPKRVQNITFSEDVSTFPSANDLSTVSSEATQMTDRTVDETTVMPLMSHGDESFDDLLTPAPRRVQTLSADQFTFPPPPSSLASSLSTVISHSISSDGADQTTYLPSGRFDETFEDPLTTPAPKRVKNLIPSPPPSTNVSPPSAAPSPTPAEAVKSFVVVPPVNVPANDSLLDESFNLLVDKAFTHPKESDLTFENLLSTPLPSLAESRTANFSPPREEDVGEETLILDEKVLEVGDVSFALLTESAGELDGGWGGEEVEWPNLASPTTAKAQTASSGAVATPKKAASESKPAVDDTTPSKLVPRTPAQASATSSGLRRAFSQVSCATPRSTTALRQEALLARTPSAANHMRKPSESSASFSSVPATDSTTRKASSSLRRTSSIDTSATPSHTRTPSLVSRTPRTSIAPPSSITNPVSSTVDRSHRRTSSVPHLTPSIARSSSAIQLASHTPRTSSTFARAPLGEMNARSSLSHSTSLTGKISSQPKVDRSTIGTLHKKDGTRSLNSSTSDHLSIQQDSAKRPLESISQLSERVAASRLNARSLHTLFPSSALPASTTSTTASKIARPASMSGLRAPVGSRSLTGLNAGASTGQVPTLESVRAALASLEARRRK